MVRHRTSTRVLSLPENQSALAAVREVVDCLRGGRSLRWPILYLHGAAGTGKTCLVNWLAAELGRGGSDLTTQRFDANDLNQPFETRRPGKIFAPNRKTETAENDWRELARSCDLLIIEDLQHLGPQTVQPLTELLDNRASEARATLLTARLGPQHLAYRGSRFPARFTSRLAGGLVIHLQPLQAESRFALLQEMAQQRQLAVSHDVLRWLAEHLSGGGRQLLGALERIEALWRMKTIGRDAAALIEHFKDDVAAGKPGLDSITERVSAFFQVDAEQLQSPSRLRNILLPRQVSMYLARKLTGLSLEQIGAWFGGRDHTTVLHACRKVEGALANDVLLSGAVRQIHAELA